MFFKNHQPPTGKKCPFRAEVQEMQNELADLPRSSVGAFPLMEKFAEQLSAMQSQMNDLQQQLGGGLIEDSTPVFTMPSEHTVVGGSQMQDSAQVSHRKTQQHYNVSATAKTNKTAVNSDRSDDGGATNACSDQMMPSDLREMTPLLNTHDTDQSRVSNKRHGVVFSQDISGGADNSNENAHIIEIPGVADNYQQMAAPPAAELTRAMNTSNSFRRDRHQGSNQMANFANPNAENFDQVGGQGVYIPGCSPAAGNAVERVSVPAGAVGGARSQVAGQGGCLPYYPHAAENGVDCGVVSAGAVGGASSQVAGQGGCLPYFPHAAENGADCGAVPAGAVGGARSQVAGQGGCLPYYPHVTENVGDHGGVAAGAVGGAHSPDGVGFMQRASCAQSGYQHGFHPAQQQRGFGTLRRDLHPLPAGPHFQQAGHMNFDTDGRYAVDPALQHRNGIPVVNDLRNDNNINSQVARRLAQLDFDSEFVDNGFETQGRRRGKKSGQSRTVEDTVIREIDWPHFYVYRGNERRPIHYSDLTISEFVLGFLSMIDNQRNGFNRDLMLSLLKDMMNDVSQYGWSQIRNYYKILASGIEMARYDWTDTSQIASIRAQYAHRQVQQPSRQNSRNGVMGQQAANSAALQNGSAKLCILYQKGECRFQASHEEWMHVCAHCFNVDGLLFNHAEKDCRRKYYHTKNVQKGEN